MLLDPWLSSLSSWTSASLWRSRVHSMSSSTSWPTSSWKRTRMTRRLCCWCKESRYALLFSAASVEDSPVIKNNHLWPGLKKKNRLLFLLSGASKQHKGWILFPGSSQTGQRRLLLLENILLNEFIAHITICLSLPILFLPPCPACVTQTGCNLDRRHADLSACCSALL